MRTLCKSDKKELQTLASDFCVSHKDEVQEIMNCNIYEEGRREILKAYEVAYMK